MSSRRWVILVCLVLAAWPASASADLSYRGAQMHPWGVGGGRDPMDNIRELDKLQAAGANTVRMDMLWADIEPFRDQIDAGFRQRTDDFVAAANARGLKPIMNVTATPCWASSDPNKGGCQRYEDRFNGSQYAPTDAADLGDIAAYLANRYTTNGFQLAAFEVWNEPNWCYFKISSQPPDCPPPAGIDPAANEKAAVYATMVKATYPRVKSAAPSLPVLAGALGDYKPIEFLQALYGHGIYGYYDAISIHPYNRKWAPSSTGSEDGRPLGQIFRKYVPEARRVMDENEPGTATKPMWITEMGWPTCAVDNGYCTTEANQAAFTKQAFSMIRTEWPYVEAASVYEIRDSAVSDPIQATFGLLRGDFSEKPAFAAFKLAITPYVERVRRTPGLLSYWRLGESSGSTAIDDRSRSNGTYSGVTLQQPGISGADGNKSSLLDTSDAVSIPHVSAYNLNAFTVEAWVYLTAYGNTGVYRPLIRKGETTGTRNFGLFLTGGTGGRVHFSMGTGTGWINEDSVGSLQLGRWHHLAFVHPASGRPALYMDGVLDKRSLYAGIPATSTNPISVRADYTGGTQAPVGRMDEVAIYNAALTDAQVKEHYDAGVFPGP